MGKTITIGNRQYDAVTGLPVSDSGGAHVGHISRRTLRAPHKLDKQPEFKKDSSATRHQVKPAHQIHGKVQKSTTLKRAYIKKRPAVSSPAQPSKPMADITPKSSVATSAMPKSIIDKHKKPHESIISRPNSKRVDGVHAPKQRSLTRNTNSPVASTTVPIVTTTDNQPIAAPQEHPIAKKVNDTQKLRRHHAEIKKQSQSQPTPASVIKQAVENEALQNAPKHHAKQKKTGFKYRTKMASLVFGSLALVMLGGYMTYLNAPNLSVRIAAAQAGIDASYPNYHPDGYSLHGPVAYNKGEVSMTFVANANKEVSYLVQQSKSDWDSMSLLENYVKDQSGGEYSTSQLNGRTIYTYKGNAAWVSGGILYTINGNAQLSPEQIRKIASSLS